jgi:hypothetical protein
MPVWARLDPNLKPLHKLGKFASQSLIDENVQSDRVREGIS